MPKLLTAKPMNGKSVKPNVKTILITQHKPENDKNPYADLAKKHKLTIDFMPFIHLEAVSIREFRRLKINPEDFKSVIFTSRNTVDQYFKLCDELRAKISPDGKYYCMTEAIALYLQKYILYRKRKVFFGDGTFTGLFEIIEKHRDIEKYLIPCSDNHKSDIADYLKKKKYDYAEAVIFNTVPVKLNLKELYKYDMIVFFTPVGVQSIKHNFANFKQKHIKMGAFGPLTAQAVVNAKLRLDLQAPAPGIPSMAMAIAEYLLG
ncbi:MAG: uroporphyrinogen-III synthase [Ignavibacteria bacterium]|nr:uroporphyrinogen-III synthase [Ignavibacteria bacterium]